MTDAAMGNTVGVMGVRAIQLRRRGRCRSCRTELFAGDTAYYDADARRVACRACARGDRPTLPFEGPRAPRPPSAPRPSAAERQRVRALIADARAALDASKRAS